MQVKDAHKKRHSVALLGVACLLLQLAIAPNFTMGNGVANFALVYTGIIALYYGGKMGVLAGFFSGLLFDFTATTPVGLMALLLTIFAYLLGSETRNRFSDGFVSSFTTFGIGALLVVLAYHLTMLLLGDSINLYDVVVLRTLPSFALTFIAFAPFGYWEVRVSSKLRGMKGSGSKPHLGSQHYDVSNL